MSARATASSEPQQSVTPQPGGSHAGNGSGRPDVRRASCRAQQAHAGRDQPVPAELRALHRLRMPPPARRRCVVSVLWSATACDHGCALDRRTGGCPRTRTRMGRIRRWHHVSAQADCSASLRVAGGVGRGHALGARAFSVRSRQADCSANRRSAVACHRPRRASGAGSVQLPPRPNRANLTYLCRITNRVGPNFTTASARRITT